MTSAISRSGLPAPVASARAEPSPAAAAAAAPAAPRTGDHFLDGAEQPALGAELAAQPELASGLTLLSEISARRAEVSAELKAQLGALSAWRDAHGGLDSVSRLGAGLGKAVGGLLSGHGLEGVKETVTDAEALERAPQRARISELNRTLKALDDAALAVANGRGLEAGLARADWRLAELAGPPASPEALTRGRLALLQASASAGAADAARELYGAALQPTLTAKGPDGQSVLTGADGKPSLTAGINRLIATGVVDTGGRAVCTAAELRALAPKLEEIRADYGKRGFGKGGFLGLEAKQTRPDARAALQGLEPAAIEAEASRLEALEAAPGHAALLPWVAQVQAQLGVLEEKTRKGFLRQAGEGLHHILDAPQTWAMVGVGALVGGVGARGLAAGLRAAGVNAPRGALLAGGAAVDGALFHTGMNGFEVLRGKPERAGWGLGDYTRSIILFETLTGARALHLRREAAALAAGKGAGAHAVNAAVYLGSEVGALTGLALGEQYLRSGDLSGASQVLVENFEFLLAMRMLAAARSARSGGSPAELAELSRAEGPALAAVREASANPSPASLGRAFAAARGYAERLNALAAGAQARLSAVARPWHAALGQALSRLAPAHGPFIFRKPGVAPLFDEVNRAPAAAPPTVILFGATGDLAKRKLFPAFHELTEQKLIPEGTRVVAVGRSDLPEEAFREQTRENARTLGGVDETSEAWRSLEQRLSFQKVDEDPASLEALKARLDALDAEAGGAGERIFYFSLPPSAVAPTIERLSRAGLIGPQEGGVDPRLIIEKPFGSNEASARALNAEIAELAGEKNVYRIDHYLGKAGVLNLLALRFADKDLERVWNREFVNRIEVRATEKIGIEGRGAFYEDVGALRDMIQGHLLQTLGMATLPLPKRATAEAISDAKAQLLKSIQTVGPEQVEANAVRGQYAPSDAGIGYQAEKGVAEGSQRETFAALKLNIDTPQWRGVPVVLETGKALEGKRSEVVVHFSHLTPALAKRLGVSPDAEAELVAAIDPTPSLTLRSGDKQLELTAPARLNPLDPYARHIRNVIDGETALSVRGDETQAQWHVVDPVLNAWESGKAPEVATYPRGSDGPEEKVRLFGDRE